MNWSEIDKDTFKYHDYLKVNKISFNKETEYFEIRSNSGVSIALVWHVLFESL